MTVTIEKGIAKGTVCAPPSKSMAHRNLICGALSEKSIITGVEYSQDILATLDCLKSLGAKVSIEGDTVIIGGISADNSVTETLVCRESGSTMRFLIPICLLFGKEITLTGSGKLMERPMDIYEKLCKENGFFFKKDKDFIKVSGKLSGGVYEVDGGVSSQFISGLLFALPLAENDSVINITGNLESTSYLNLTISSLKAFGIEIDSSNIRQIKIKGKQTYQPRKLQVEGDYSNAAFFDALNMLGGQVTTTGLSSDSLQGDKVYRDLFLKLKGDNAQISLADCPDLGPILFGLAAAGKGALFTDTKRLRIKESDRVLCMVKELSKFGVRADVYENSVRIYASELKKPTEPLFAHNDHRIAMTLTILSTVTGGVINDAQAVNKSFPDFFEKLSLLEIKVHKNET